MCDVCKMNTCHPKCPNAEEQKFLYSCDVCWKNNIFAGDTYYKIADMIICEECMENSKREARGD